MDPKEEALRALVDLPSVFQAIGTTAAAARRCKPTTPRGKLLWAEYERLNREGARLLSLVRLYISVAKD